ncbi:MAG: vacuolar sorting protein VPS33/slp1 [Chaenotheca gracillima]|nr:MAG: vacuolar sorting protein VPS33/slp1 [Chaenotheca gracillima]
MQSLRIVPSKGHPTSTPAATKSAPSAPGLPDTIRSSSNSGLKSTEPAGSVASTHPLETRLASWRATQEALRAETLRRTFGIAEPIRRGMEARIVADGEWRPACLGGGAGVHADILAGRDWGCDWEDVFVGDPTRENEDFHAEMERRVKMD